ncbi:hypothetical protein TNCV_902011 [Trichonephila clavipes]|nr:hypothetical protein TNCV_902011 [Trichonephila clavipes]
MTPKWSPKLPNRPPTWSPKMMPTWLYRQDFAKFSFNRHYNKIPEGSELANKVVNDAKIVAKVAKLTANLVANLALPPKFRQVLIQSPL